MRTMNSRRWVLGAVAALLLIPGCASRNLTKDRMRVVEAEAINARQEARDANEEARLAQIRADQLAAERQESEARLRQKEQETLALSREAAAGQQAQVALARQAEAARRQSAELRELQTEVGNLMEMVSLYKRQYAQDNANKAFDAPPQPSESLQAFRRDLESRLRNRGINLPVETRTLQTGEQQVAIVLRGAFPAGKHSLAHDMDAVKAVVWLGELISREYPGSRVRIEGHTDGDPLKASKGRYRDNYDLSLQRASSVEDLLVKAGVPAGNVETVGMGADRPLEPETTKRAKEVNRRVEIYIQPSV